jgi:2C-methyl-D-erythritol 2,4-cyclodiphosphate synthase
MITIFKQDNNKALLKKVYNKFQKDKWVNGNIVKVLEKNIKKFLKINHSISTCNSGSDA